MRSYQASRSSVSSQRNNRTRYGTQGRVKFSVKFSIRRPEWKFCPARPKQSAGLQPTVGQLSYHR
jgi:hypothetical protein